MEKGFFVGVADPIKEAVDAAIQADAERHHFSTRLILRVSGCDVMTPYEKRALYQVEQLAFGQAGSLKRMLTLDHHNPCRVRFQFHREKGMGPGNVAHALEHLIVFTAGKLRNQASLSGLVSGMTQMGKDNIPIITLCSDSYSDPDIDGAKEIFWKAIRIVTDAVNKKLLVRKGPDRNISFSAR